MVTRVYQLPVHIRFQRESTMTLSQLPDALESLLQ